MKFSFRIQFIVTAIAGALLSPWTMPAQDAPRPDAPSAATAPSPDAPAAAPAPAAEPPPPATPDARLPDGGLVIRYDRRTRNSDGGFPMGDHFVPKGATANEVVSVLGSSRVEGEARYDVVSILGHAAVGPEGKVGGDVVSINGDLDIRGDVRRGAVNVLGHAKVDGHVGNDLVVVLGDLELGPNAVIDGNIVLTGGRLIRDPKAVVRGNLISAPGAERLGGVVWLVNWVRECLLWLRPLGFDRDLRSAWLVALGLLGFYAILALLFQRSVERCIDTLAQRPGRSIFSSIFVVLLIPVAAVLLAVSIVGIPVLPFFFVGVLCAAVFGKTVMLAVIGRPFARFYGEGPLGHVAFSVVVGGCVTLLLYTIPVFGAVLFVLLGWLGLGVVVYTVILASKREKPAAPVPPVPPAAPRPPVAPPPPTVPVVPVVPVASVPFAALPVAGVAEASGVADLPPPVAPLPSADAVPPPPPAYRPPVSAEATLPRAGFWLRLAALVLDVMLFMIFFVAWVIFRPHGAHIFNPLALVPWLAAYAAVMWKFKGTTVGGVVCGLKVVRVDGRELDWPTTIARALGCFLSLIVAGLGFVWVAFDSERQSWHDKIAGTTVVRMPAGTSLL